MDKGDPIDPNSASKQGDTGPNAVPLAETVKRDDAGRGIAIDETEEARIKASQANESRETSQQEILDRIKAGEMWMIFFTAIVALTTAAQFIQSGCNNRSTSKQVDRIIGAANIQADASTRAANAAEKVESASERQATAAESFATTANTAVSEFKKAASESTAVAQRQATATEKSVTEAATAAQNALNATLGIAQLDQRAWVGYKQDAIVKFEQDQPFEAVVFLQNTGHMPAFFAKDSFKSLVMPIELENPCDFPEGGFGPNPPGWENIGAIAPQSIFRLTAKDDPKIMQVGRVHDAIKTRKWFLYICGKVTYHLDNLPLGPRHIILLPSTTFCLVYDALIEDFRQCSEGNNME